MFWQWTGLPLFSLTLLPAGIALASGWHRPGCGPGSHRYAPTAGPSSRSTP